MLRAWTLVGLCVLVPESLLAQTTASGGVRGVVRDQSGGALPGASISAASPTVPGTFTAISDGQGRYRLGDLPPGTFTIAAALDGFSKFVRPGVDVRAGLTVDVEITMTLGAVTETVEVTQETPLLESRSAARAVNISGEMLRAVPLSERREWFGALFLAPGVVIGEAQNNEKFLSVHGADSSSNVVQIDGADMTPSAGATLRYTSLNIDAVDDIQIKTAGVDASAPLGQGGIINIATASGTNQVKGAVTAFVQPRAWNASNTPGGTSSTTDQRQIDAAVGTPIIRNHLWAFGAYRGVDTTTGISRTAAQLTALRALVPGFEPFDSSNVAHLWFAKISAQPTSAHQLAGFYQRDVNPFSFADAITARRREEATGGTGASGRMSSIWSDRFTTRIGASYNDKRRDVLHALDPQEPLQIVYASTIASGSVLVGNGRLVNRGAPLTGGGVQLNSKVTLSLDATWFVGGGRGSHEIQSGLYAQPRIQNGLFDNYPNGGFVLEETTLRQPGDYSAVVPFHRTILDGATLLRSRRRGQDYAVYVQDAWRPTSRLTLSAGIRIDRVTWRDRMFNVTSQRSTEVGPRVGVNYAVTADTRNVARAHWVRVHDQPSQTGMTIGTAALGQRDLYDLNVDGTFETVLVRPATFAITPARSIHSGFHQPYVQEWGAGYDKQLAGRVTAGVDLVHRDFRDRPTLIDTNSQFNGSVFAGYADESFNEIYQVTNNRWNRPVYTSLEASLTKRTPRVQAIASYLRQWRHIAGTWQPNDPASFIQPSAFPNDRGIGSTLGSTASPIDANGLSGTHMTQGAGSATQWRDHVVRTGITYYARWDILIAASYTFQSGGWSGPIVTRVAAADPAYGPSRVTLSNGRIATNPLSTVIRFAYPTRGDGQITTPALHVLNARAGRRFSYRKLAFDASLDVFNITNNDADQQFVFGANQTFNPLFGTMTFRQLPRSAQVVLRASF